MSPVQDPQINGGSMFAATSVDGPAVLTWSAPSGAVPAGYSVDIDPVEKDDSGYYLGDGVLFYTPSTSIAVPTGLLTSGKMYVFTITAVADAKANFAIAPWRSAYPLAWADAVSGVRTYNETESKNRAIRLKSVPSIRNAVGGGVRHSGRVGAQQMTALRSALRRSLSQSNTSTR